VEIIGPQATILVVEDDPSMLEILVFLLEDEGYTVLAADRGDAALSLLQKNDKPDLIVSDVTMPGMSGFDLYERIRSRVDWAQIPFIFLTARGQRADMRRGMELGADDYLIKPFEPEELVAAVKVRLARAAEAQAAADVLASGWQERIIRTLTHEFRTPLALVVGYTELLESTGQEMNEGDFQTALQGLHAGSERLKGLVEDFLLLSRLNTGSLSGQILETSRETDEPGRVVDRVVEQIESLAARRKVSIRTRQEDLDRSVAIDHHHLFEIIRRLVENSVKFSKPEGGEVTISTAQDGDFWVMDVIDDGIGISPDDLPRIFEAFRQVDREKLEQQGPGLGLTIVQGLVDMYGGRVEVHSAPGEGSTFSVWLPLAPG
jgi:signal transduction histidine kinase